MNPNEKRPDIEADVEAISSIPIISNLLEVICRSTGMGFAAVARVTEQQWMACCVRDEINFGLKAGGELKLETTICNEIRQSGNAVIIDSVDKDPHYCSHHTPAMYGFQSYISIPIIRKDGSFFGTLCAIDPHPRLLNTVETVGMFNLFADLISFHLSSVDELKATEEKLIEERKIAQLRDQFVAVLAHDLRNPVGAVLNSAQLLKRMKLDGQAMRIANIIYDSSYRMKNLLENILDFAQGKMGGGIKLDRGQYESLEQNLKHVVTELQILHPDRFIERDFKLETPFKCDNKRIAQLFSNLLSNALKYGKSDASILVKAFSDEKEFILSVTNQGKKIPVVVMERLFQPFSRGEVKTGQEGLGLGLFISAEIAKAHGGELNVISTNEETAFTLRIPVHHF